MKLNPFLEAVADRIRLGRSKFPGLCPLDIAPDLQSIIGSLEGEEVFIENELHSCVGIRKFHLEIAVIGNDLQILHCILFPDPKFNIPIFGADIVVSSLSVSAAIMDLSPVTGDLPHNISSKLDKLSLPKFTQVRRLPSWGKIFSPYVQFIRPSGIEEKSLFLDLLDSYMQILLSVLAETSPQELDSPYTIERHKAQIRYCNQQKLNDKTKAVLSKAFGIHWAERYIEKLLFDIPPAL